MLYNQSARDPDLARALAQATRDASPGLILLGLPRSQHESAARETGVPFAAEAFADRACKADGLLISRAQEASVLHDPDAIAKRVVRMVAEGTVVTAQRDLIAIRADSICVHGDNPAACRILETVRRALDEAGLHISPLREVLSL